MDQINVLAASGLRSRMESLDMLANNLANAATSGYKNDREFYGVFASAEAKPDANANLMVLPVVERHWTDFTQGLLQPTANQLDLALSGKGFFAVSGPSAKALYTRNGNFHISTANQLVNTDGYPLRGVDGNAIKVNPALPIQISKDGAVTQASTKVGQLAVVNFKDESALKKQGASYFTPADEKIKPDPSTAEVHQGKIEASNVGSAESAVRLVGIMRQFEMLQKAITMSTEMNRKAVEEVARINS